MILFSMPGKDISSYIKMVMTLSKWCDWSAFHYNLVKADKNDNSDAIIKQRFAIDLGNERTKKKTIKKTDRVTYQQ
jgi:hypothetical protein